jgi:hypothetical protein
LVEYFSGNARYMQNDFEGGSRATSTHTVASKWPFREGVGIGRAGGAPARGVKG